MSFSIFINFKGNCQEAIKFYSEAFNTEAEQLMTYDQMPANADPNYTLKEEDKKKVAFCNIKIFGGDVMFCDVPEEMPMTVGNNISPTISSKDVSEVRRAFEALQVGGTVDMELQKTFWSDLYGMVTDKFGISWQIMVEGQ